MLSYASCASPDATATRRLPRGPCHHAPPRVTLQPRRPVLHLSLKRASEVARAALDAAAALKPDPRVALSIHTDDAPAALDEAEADFRADVARVEALIGAGYALRRALGAANAAAGVTDLLTRRAELDLLEKRLAALTERLPSPRQAEREWGEAAARVGSLRRRVEGGTAGYGAGDAVSLPVASAATREALLDRLALLRAEREMLGERLAAANLAATVQLEPAHEATLRHARLLA